MLKFFEIETRFRAYPEEIPGQAVGYVATQVQVGPSEFAKYSFISRTMEYHRRQIRTA